MEHDSLPKGVKKKLAELLTTAHETALRQELLKLREDFARWDRGEIDAFELTARIHKYHDGPDREIYKRFTYSSHRDLPILVASAIHSGLIAEESVPPEVLPHLKHYLAFLRST